MKIVLTKIMGIDLEKPIQIDMHKNLGKISEYSNLQAYEKLNSLFSSGDKIAYNALHCYGYVNDNKEDVVKITLCKGIIKKISSLHLDYECLIVGQHCENYENLTTTSCTLELHYDGINSEIYEKVLSSMGKVFEINKKSECIMSYKHNILTIKIISLKNHAYFSKLIELITYMYEVIFLTEGFFPKRIKMTSAFTNVEGESEIYFRFNTSYNNHRTENTEIGAQVFKRDTILKEWILFRKKTEILFDYYLHSTNRVQYVDEDLFHLITVLEGYSKYRDYINSDHKKRNKRGYIKLYDRLKSLNIETPECKIIFSSQIQEGEDYILKLVEHRNDFSHQFQYKKPFEEDQMKEFYHKIKLLLRVLFFREIGIDVQDRQIKVIIRKYFKNKHFVPIYNRVLSDSGEVVELVEEEFL